MRRVWFKQGVIGTLHPLAQRGFGLAVALYFSKGADFFCTSIQEATHNPGSLHYGGFAWDQLALDVDRAELQAALDVCFTHKRKWWDVVPFKSGNELLFHVELDMRWWAALEEFAARVPLAVASEPIQPAGDPNWGTA